MATLEHNWFFSPYELDYTLKYGNIIYLNCSKVVNGDPWYVDTAPCIKRDSKSYLYAFATGKYNSYNLFNYSNTERVKDYCQVKVVALTSISDFSNKVVREDVPI